MEPIIASGVASAGDLLLYLMVAPFLVILTCLLAGSFFAIQHQVSRAIHWWHEHHAPPVAPPSNGP